MAKSYTAVVKQDGDWWIGWIAEVPGVNCQENSLETLRKSLRIALREAIDQNRNDALAAAGSDYREETVRV